MAATGGDKGGATCFCNFAAVIRDYTRSHVWCPMDVNINVRGNLTGFRYHMCHNKCLTTLLNTSVQLNTYSESNGQSKPTAATAGRVCIKQGTGIKIC